MWCSSNTGTHRHICVRHGHHRQAQSTAAPIMMQVLLQAGALAAGNRARVRAVAAYAAGGTAPSSHALVFSAESTVAAVATLLLLVLSPHFCCTPSMQLHNRLSK